MTTCSTPVGLVPLPTENIATLGMKLTVAMQNAADTAAPAPTPGPTLSTAAQMTALSCQPQYATGRTPPQPTATAAAANRFLPPRPVARGRPVRILLDPVPIFVARPRPAEVSRPARERAGAYSVHHHLLHRPRLADHRVPAASMEKIVTTPRSYVAYFVLFVNVTVGGTALGVASFPQKRSPCCPRRIGQQGKLPFWTAPHCRVFPPVPHLAYKNLVDAQGTITKKRNLVVEPPVPEVLMAVVSTRGRVG